MDNSIDAQRRLEFHETNIEVEPMEKSGEEHINGNHLDIDDKTIPRIGLEFESEEAAYIFYNEYARKVGFGIRKHKVHFDLTGGNRKVLDRIFCCRSQGYRGKNNRDTGNKFNHPLTRTGCRAMMKINCRQNDRYIVVEFIAEHNGHELSGIAPKAGFDLISKQMGGRENVGFIIEDYKNHLSSKRSLEMKTGEGGGALEYLKQKQIDNPNFFYAMQLDQDDLIANIIWIDAQMMNDYAHFGDVVCFDTTHRKNKEGRPFALFVGVNHHHQTTIFGAALLYDETIETFRWVFDTFAKAMSGKEPQTILTDQDAAMANALATQWPKTCHHLCIWHIYQNAATNISHVFGQFPSFSKDFRACIYDYDEEDDFLRAWQCMLEKYGLETNKWLERLFKIREKWALVYGRRSFCADMTSTQRSESMNSSLKKYVSYKHNLLRFFQHFDRMLEDRRYKEFKADFRTSESTPMAVIPVQILKHAACVYTHAVFKLFQEEVHKAYDSKLELCFENGDNSEYKISLVGNKVQHIVKFCSSINTVTVSCSCRNFEFAGILCSHVLKVFSWRNIVKIPDEYILKRWTKNAKKNIGNALMETTLGSSGTLVEIDEKKLRGVWCKNLWNMYNQLSTRATMTAGTFEVASNGIRKLIEEVNANLENIALEVSKSGLRQTSTVEKLKKTQDEEKVSGEVIVKGWKSKGKKPISSGRRPRSGLEKRPRKKKQNNVALQIENNDHMQCIGNESNIPSVNASVGYSFIPSLSQFSQEFDMSKSSSVIEGSLMPHGEPYQFTQVFNHILNKSPETSLTQLLQQQMTKQQVSGVHDNVRFNNSTQES